MADEAIEAPDKPAILRIYLKSGNVITLPRVTEIGWEERYGGRTVSITQGGPPGGERLLVKTLDLTQVEAMTWEGPADG